MWAFCALTCNPCQKTKTPQDLPGADEGKGMVLPSIRKHQMGLGQEISRRGLCWSVQNHLGTAEFCPQGAVELEMGDSRGEGGVIWALYPNPTHYTGIHFEGIPALTPLSQVWHPECDRSTMGFTERSHQRSKPAGEVQSFTLCTLCWKGSCCRSWWGHSPPAPPSSYGEPSQETLSCLGVSLSCRWSFQGLLLASGTDNEFILSLYAFFAFHILASTRELFSEPWRYSCPEGIHWINVFFFYSRQRKGKSSSIYNSPAFSGPENNSNIDQLHLNPKCF